MAKSWQMERGRKHPFFSDLEIVVAHQGGTGRNRGNQLASFRYAHENGFAILDLDVVATSDLKLLVFHDGHLDRLTTGRGKVAENSSEHIAATVRYQPEFLAAGSADGQLPELEAIFTEFPDAKFNIEVKNALAVEPLIARLSALKPAQLARINLSGSESACAVLRQELPDAAHTLTQAALFKVLLGRGWPAGVDCAQLPIRFGLFDVHHNPWVRRLLGRIKFGPRLLLPLMKRVVRVADAANAPVYFWTVDDLGEAHSVMSFGAVGVLSDRPVALRTELNLNQK